MIAEATTLEAPRTVTRFPGKYLSITSYRRDGTPVATPVWFVEDLDRLVVVTDAASGKVKRIKRDPRVEIAACSARGAPRAEPITAHAELLSDDELEPVKRLIEAKYHRDLIFVKPVRAIQAKLHIGPKQTREVVLRITPRG